MPPNMYGPNDNYDPKNSHFYPALLRKIYQSKKRNKKYRSVKASDLAVTIKEFSGLESGKSIYHFQDFLKR